MKLITILKFCATTTAIAVGHSGKHNQKELETSQQKADSPYETIHRSETVEARKRYIHAFEHLGTNQDVIKTADTLLQEKINELQDSKESEEYARIEDLKYKAYLKNYYAMVQPIMIRDYARFAASDIKYKNYETTKNYLQTEKEYNSTMEDVDKSIQSFKVNVDKIYQLQLKEIKDTERFDIHDESSTNEIVDPTDDIQATKDSVDIPEEKEEFLDDINDEDENDITDGHKGSGEDENDITSGSEE